MATLESTGSPTTRARTSGHFTIHEEEDGKHSTAGATRRISLVSHCIQVGTTHRPDQKNRVQSMDMTPLVAQHLYRHRSLATCRLNLEQTLAAR